MPLSCLRPGTWLHSDVITVYIHQLNKDIPLDSLCLPPGKECLSNLFGSLKVKKYKIAGRNFRDVTKWYIPLMNRAQDHYFWLLVDVSQLCITAYDPYGMDRTAEMTSIDVKTITRAPFRLENFFKKPVQDDGFSCGVWQVAGIELVSKGQTNLENVVSDAYALDPDAYKAKVHKFVHEWRIKLLACFLTSKSIGVQRPNFQRVTASPKRSVVRFRVS